jgi:hypothetical protein
MSFQILHHHFYTEFRELLIECFDEAQLKRLCDDLDIDFDGLPGSGKKDKARELVQYFKRNETPDGILKALRLIERKRDARRKQFEYVKLYVELYVELPSGNEKEEWLGVIRLGRKLEKIAPDFYKDAEAQERVDLAKQKAFKQLTDELSREQWREVRKTGLDMLQLLLPTDPLHPAVQELVDQATQGRREQLYDQIKNCQ